MGGGGAGGGGGGGGDPFLAPGSPPPLRLSLLDPSCSLGPLHRALSGGRRSTGLFQKRGRFTPPRLAPWSVGLSRRASQPAGAFFKHRAWRGEPFLSMPPPAAPAPPPPPPPPTCLCLLSAAKAHRRPSDRVAARC